MRSKAESQRQLDAEGGEVAAYVRQHAAHVRNRDASLRLLRGLRVVMDVMLGGVCMGAVIFSQESDKRVAAAWTLPIFLLGHVVSVAWLLVRFLPKKAA